MVAEEVSADGATDFGVPLGRWYSVVRRSRLADHKKRSVALTVGSYADTDGTSVKCGVARLAADCEMGFSTARRYLAWLREVGLIELVRIGNRKARRADEYRLTVQPHTEKALNALDESEYRDLVDGMKQTNRTGEKTRRLSALTQEVSAEARESDEPEDALLRSPMSERSNGFLRSPMSEPPPKEQRSPPTGGAPPPDPRRPEPPTASGSRLYVDRSISEPLTPAQDQQRNSLPHARAPAPGEVGDGLVFDFFTREAM